jgi:tetratricopeptide (TPR) repeat protein
VSAFLVALVIGVIVSTWQAIRATLAERAARNAQATALAERLRAENEADSARTVKEFLNKDVLAQASIDNQAVPGTKPDPNITVRTALDRAAAAIGDKFKGRPIVEASIRRTIGETYTQLGLYKEARRQLELAHGLCHPILGGNDPETLLTMRSLGQLLIKDDKIAEAAPYLLSAMRGLVTARGPDDLETLAAMRAVAQLYHLQDRHDDAEKLLLDIAERFRRAGKGQLPEAIGILNDLAIVYQARNKLDQAEQTLARVVEVLTKSPGSEHPTTLSAMGNLGAVYISQHKLEEAETMMTQVLKVERKLWGDKHPATLTRMIRVGEIRLYRSNLNEAEAVLLEALEGCRTAVDSQHIMTDAALGLLAAVYAQRHDMKKLGPVLMEARDLTRAKFGPDNGLTAAADWSAALFCLNQGDFTSAETYFRERLAFLVKHKPDDWTRFVTEGTLGRCLIAQKNWAEAEVHLLSAFNGMKPHENGPPPANRTELRAVIGLIQALYEGSGKSEKALEWRNRGADFGFPVNPFAPL